MLSWISGGHRFRGNLFKLSSLSRSTSLTQGLEMINGPPRFCHSGSELDEWLNDRNVTCTVVSPAERASNSVSCCARVYTGDGTSVYSQCTAHSYKHGTFGKCVVLGDINGTFYF
jgi:hypothetical protein